MAAQYIHSVNSMAKTRFYLPHMKSIGFTCKKMYCKFIFHDFLYLKKVKSEKKNCLSRGVLPEVVGRNFIDDISAALCYKFEIFAFLHHLGWIDAPFIQNFEILKSIEKTQESKKIQNHF
jgi:hypothetical protein